jgi:hypothetical protein
MFRLGRCVRVLNSIQLPCISPLHTLIGMMLCCAGNFLNVYRSGMLASQILNIQQGEISLCCRGLKRSVLGYKFRFVGDLHPDEKYNEVQKRRKSGGYDLSSGAVAAVEPELMRSRRATRIEYEKSLQPQNEEAEKKALLAPAHVHVSSMWWRYISFSFVM